jgi:hypothetical protein
MVTPSLAYLIPMDIRTTSDHHDVGWVLDDVDTVIEAVAVIPVPTESQQQSTFQE